MEKSIELALLFFLSSALSASPICRKSEFACSNGRCIPATGFCDSIDNCGDSSDEPRFCTPCNRTYYGDVGRTYEVELLRPKEDKLPYVCSLILTAGGGDYGDLIQVTFNSFTLGKFTSFVESGCPDGYLQITEAGRPQVGGQWCGTSWGPTIYYSETRSVVLTVRLSRLSKDQSGYNFDFRIAFKMLSESAAVVRYGGATPGPYNPERDFNITTLYQLPAPTQAPSHYLGDLISSTYCSRIFSECSEKACRLQSPNFPGIYPRNLTCYYAVRQHTVMPGQHALISVRQNKGQFIEIRSSANLYARSQQQQFTAAKTRQLKVWGECDEVQDYVTIYDGYTTRDPVLLKFCGGGEKVPIVTSSGPEILVEFTTSPFGTFLHPGPPQSFHGFQLEVEVTFLDKESSSYIRNKKCEFTIRGSDKGVIESPRHSLPPNITCIYHLEGMNPLRIAPTFRPAPGRFPAQYDPHYYIKQYVPPPPQYRVWLSVLKFHVTPKFGPTNVPIMEPCGTHLQVWDGTTKDQACNDVFCEKERPRSGNSAHKGNLTLLARYCRDHVPRSCDHGLLGNSSRYPRPCTLTESYLSVGNAMTLQLKTEDSTSLRPVSFKALYEFVDLHQDGEPFGRGPCSRRFVSRSGGPIPNFPQKFQSPKDVFLFGRGGNTNLSCVYRFEGQKGERLKLIIQQLETGGRPCISVYDEDTSRMSCHGASTTALRILEYPLPETPPLTRHCLCSSKDITPFSFTSAGHIVELRFDLLYMNASDDFRSLNFVGSWEFIRQTVCVRQQRLMGPSGEISLLAPSRTPEEINCEYQPWVIEPNNGRYLYVSVRGSLIDPQRLTYWDILNNLTMSDKRTPCDTRNRIIIHAGPDSTHIVCPYPSPEDRKNMVEVFSEGWQIPLGTHPISVYLLDEVRERSSRARSVVVEFLGREHGYYSVSWLELTRRKRVLPPEGFVMKDCIYRCPELDACINSSLWCDGVSHCPSGYDESIRHCYEIFQLPVLYLIFGTIGIACLSCAVCVVFMRYCRKRRRQQARLKASYSSEPAIFGDKEVIC